MLEVKDGEYEFIVAKYDKVGESIKQGGQYNSVWWNNLIGIKDGTGVGRLFDDNIGER